MLIEMENGSVKHRVSKLLRITFWLTSPLCFFGVPIASAKTESHCFRQATSCVGPKSSGLNDGHKRDIWNLYITQKYFVKYKITTHGISGWTKTLSSFETLGIIALRGNRKYSLEKAFDSTYKFSTCADSAESAN